MIIGIAIAYLMALLAIGVWATRRTQTARDFFVAGSGIGLVTLAISAMAATLSGFAFIGGPGFIYRAGLGAAFIVFPSAITNTLSAWVMAKRLRLLAEVRDVVTIPDAIRIRYDSPLAQGLAAVAIVLAVIGYIGTNLLALGLVIDPIFGTGLRPAILIGSAVVLAYSVSGGILAGIYNDVLQGLIMAVASVLVFLRALDVTGGLSGLSHTLMRVAPEHLAPWGTLTPLAAMSYFFVFGMGTLGQPHVLHKFYMLRDPLKLRWFPVGMTLAMTLTLLLFVGVGLAMKVVVATGATPPLANPDDATPAFLLRFASEPLAGLVFTAAAAAIMSTVNSFLSVGAAALTRDLPRALGRPIANELQWGRRWTVALMLLATLVAVQPGVVVAFLGIFGWGLFASTLVPALTVGLNWEGATRTGAVASIATGLVATLVLETLAWLKWFALPAGVTATAVTLVASLLVFLVVSHVTRGAHEPLAPDVAAVLRA